MGAKITVRPSPVSQNAFVVECTHLFDTRSEESRFGNALLRTQGVARIAPTPDQNFIVHLRRLSPEERDRVLNSIRENLSMFLVQEGQRNVQIVMPR